MRILFICTGNTCRSPMAEGYLRSKALPGVSVKSRGLAANGAPVSVNAAAVMKEAGIDLSGHISAPLTACDLREADRIICLSPSHREYLLHAGVPAEKLSVLGEGISDPFGGDMACYRSCRDEIFKAIDALTDSGFFRDFQITAFAERHLAAVAKLESTCFSEPWSAEGILESHRNGTHFFVAENRDHILGYVGLNAVLDEGYITNIAVFPQYRRQGVATALLEEVFRFAGQQGLCFVSLEVRESNREAITLYEKLGFAAEGCRRDFYRNPRENAKIMTKRFETHENTGH